MRSLLVLAALTATHAGCEVDDNHAEALCTALCDCQTSLPVQHSSCVSECVGDFPSSLPAACVDCILTASCTELLSGGCADPC